MKDDNDHWRDRAACGETWRTGEADWFFEPSIPMSVDYAKAMCKGCPVADQCLAYALDHNEQYGIWGGLDADERRQLLRRRMRERRLMMGARDPWRRTA